MRFDDRVAVVTGAGRGIGREAAVALGREGAAVVLTARHDEEISAAAKEIIAAGGRALALTSDVAEPGSMVAVAERATAEFGRIDILVTSAATTPAVGPSETLPLADWQRVIATDLTGTF